MKHFKLFGLFIKISYRYIVFAIWVSGVLASCNTLEKASLHGLNSGYYKLKSDHLDAQNVYLESVCNVSSFEKNIFKC